MTAKQYLSQLRDMWKVLKCLDAEINTLKELQGLSAVAYDGVKVQTSNENHSMSASDRIIDKQIELRQRIDEYISKREEIRGMIERVADLEYRTILINRYVNNMPCYKIMDMLFMSSATFFRKYNIAHKEFQKIIDENESQ